MKRISILILMALLSCLFGPRAAAQASFGEAIPFNEGWKFQLQDVQEAAQPGFDDARWRPVRLPHDWSVEGRLSPANPSCQGYLPGGIGWYRLHFDGRQIEGDHAYIYFEGVYNRSSVYLNGHLLGERPSGFVSFLYELTPYLDREGDNVLAVRVDHSRIADSRWYTGSGIYRDVWLIQSGDVHFAPWGVGYTSDVDERRAVIHVDTAIEGLGGAKASVKLVLKDAEGRAVAQSSRTAAARQTVDLKLSRPHRWDITDPYLYTLEAQILSGGRVLDRTEVRVGLRSLAFDPDHGFALNGRSIKVKGVCLHHDFGVLGAAVPDEVWERRFLNLKALGVNAIRTSHNQQAPVFYDLCDRLGLLVMDEGYDEWEFAKKKWVEGWNVGTPAFYGTFDFFEEWCERDITDMVLRDRNHPSVVMWSIGNEVDYPNDPYSHPILNGDGLGFTQPISGGYDPDAPSAMRIGTIAKRLAASVHAVDRSRPVTGALAGVIMSNETEYPQAVDIVGYNYYESRYDEDHARYPDRVIYGSENRHDYNAWKAVRDREFIFGQFLWTGADYLGESNAWPSRGLGSGLLDFTSRPKPRGYFRASLWLSEPFCYIGTSRRMPDRSGAYRDTYSIDAWDDWNYAEGETVRVYCYTNAASASLFLNGREVGERKPYDDEHGMITWNVPYAPGELKAVGYGKDGSVESEYVIHTVVRPHSLRARIAPNDVGGDVRHILLEVLDDAGHVCSLADSQVTCTVTGGTLLGLETGDNTDMSDYRARVRRAFRGTLLAYVQKTGPGPLKVTFSSPLLQPTELTIE